MLGRPVCEIWFACGLWHSGKNSSVSHSYHLTIPRISRPKIFFAGWVLVEGAKRVAEPGTGFDGGGVGPGGRRIFWRDDLRVVRDFGVAAEGWVRMGRAARRESGRRRRIALQLVFDGRCRAAERTACFLEGRPLSEPEAVSSGISAWLRGGAFE